MQLAATTSLQADRTQSDADIDDEEELADPRPTGARGDPSGRLIGAAGPLIRCASARSKPVSQLSFFINNQPVNLSRTLENSTLTYSDGLESSFVSFKIELSDFLVAPAAAQFDEESGDAEREQQTRVKSLDRAASLKRKTDKAGRKATGSGDSLASQRAGLPTQSATSSPSLSTSTTTSTTIRPVNANAQVQFDEDGAQTGAARKRNEPKSRPNATGRGRQPPANHKSGRPRVATKSGEPRADNREPLPASQADKTSQPDERKSDWQTNGVIDSANYESASVATVAREALGAEEQRVQQAGRLEQQQQSAYSNYIKIKCTSLVPAVGYEMTSELNVPLTLLIPARQLSDALRAGQQEANSRPAGSQSAQVGGSLQAPRAVLIDRLAQASAPPSGVLAAPNQTSVAVWSRPIAPAAPARTSQRAPSRAKQQPGERANYLDESAGKRRQTGSGEYQ